jgi:hypothetical protein
VYVFILVVEILPNQKLKPGWIGWAGDQTGWDQHPPQNLSYSKYEVSDCMYTVCMDLGTLTGEVNSPSGLLDPVQSRPVAQPTSIARPALSCPALSCPALDFVHFDSPTTAPTTGGGGGIVDDVGSSAGWLVSR